MKINSIEAYTVFDSRGIPTVEAEVGLDNGARGRGVAPSGASTGQYEALEVRDGDRARFNGQSVDKPIRHIHDIIRPALLGRDPEDQEAVDQLMIGLDGTPNKTKLGANALLPVSMAVVSAVANARNVPLFRQLGGSEGNLIPIPEIQLIGGGAHANWRVDVQDFLLIANGARSYAEALEITFKVFQAVGKILKKTGRYYGAADEGGYWPAFDTHEQVLDLVAEGIEAAGFTPGQEASTALDVAASDLYDAATGTYHMNLEDRTLSSKGFIDLLSHWVEKYPIISIEDPLADTDREGWIRMMERHGEHLQIIGDDLFTTNPKRIRDGIKHKTANAVLIKLNQIGTVTETLEAIRITQEAGWRAVISARSGETADIFISHLAVATNAGQLKVGSFRQGERMAKWNELLRIERLLGGEARFNYWGRQ